MKHNSIPLKPPCCNDINTTASRINDAGRPLYVLVRSLDPNNLIDYWVNINKTHLETETVSRYFEKRRLEAEEDTDLLDVLPNERLYMLEIPSTVSEAVFMTLVKYVTEQTQHFDCSLKTARFICIYGKLIKTYNFLDYCDVPEL